MAQQRKYDEKRKQSNKKYMDSVTRVAIWLTPEEKTELVERADCEGKSLNGYIRNRLGFKDTPKAASTENIILSGGLDEQKCKDFCAERGLIYKSYHLASGYEKDERWTAGALEAEDKNGNSVPIPLTIEELERLRVKGCQ